MDARAFDSLLSQTIAPYFKWSSFALRFSMVSVLIFAGIGAVISLLWVPLAGGVVFTVLSALLMIIGPSVINGYAERDRELVANQAQALAAQFPGALDGLLDRNPDLGRRLEIVLTGHDDQDET